MKEIARSAGVNASTVSRVLAGHAEKARIAPATARKVMAVARKLGYRPNLAARALRTSRTKALGLLVTELANPFFATIAGAVEERARETAYATVIATTGENPEREAEYVSVLRSRPVDGLIVTPAAGKGAASELKALCKEAFPLVCIDRRIAGLNCDRVLVDNRRGAQQLVEKLVQLGARRIALAGGPLNTWTAAQRLAGWKTGLKRAGLPCPPALRSSGPFSVQTGIQAARKFMSSARPPDAILAANNRVLLGVVRVLQELGEPAREVAVGAFDGLPFAGLLGRAVVIAEQPREEIGRRAVDLLIDRIEKKYRGKPREVVLPIAVRTFGPESGPFELGA
jgi:LacI family transcriptional regulator, galactose operon repressor